MYISIIPLSHSLGKRPYTYFVGDPWKDVISVGNIVEVPIGKYMVLAIVADIDIPAPTDLLPSDIRAIIRIVAGGEIIAPYMIQPILSIADQYFLLIHKVASMYLPASLLTRLDKKNYILTPSGKEKSRGQPTLSIHQYIDHIFDRGSLSRYLVPGSVLVFPDDILLSHFESSLDEDQKKHIGIIPHDLTPTRRAQAWIDIWEKKYDIIFGTRRILYYNLSAYDHIVYIEDAQSTEQYQYPTKIRHLDLLEKIEKQKAHSITIVSSSPTLNMLSLFPNAPLQAIRN